jgi:hypothetical protein
MTTEQNVTIDPRRLFNLGANLVAAGFIKQNATEAKKLFKALKQGEAIKGGQLKVRKIRRSYSQSNLSWTARSFAANLTSPILMYRFAHY